MSMIPLPRQVLVEAFADRAGSEPGRTVCALIEWWNGHHGRFGTEADHLAAYISTPEGWWRNALWEDPTEYRLSWFDEEQSSARSEDVIVEFRVLRAIDGQSRSSPAGAVESYLLIEPADAWAWSIQAVEEVRRHLGRRSSAAGAAGLAACP